MARYSVIDLGSNTIRLVAYDVSADRHSMQKHRNSNRSKLFKEAVNEKKTVGLATYVDKGVFTKAGIDKAVSVLSELLDIANNINSDKTKIFATAVLRNCENSKEAVGAIERKIGKKIDLLSDTEEAHLGYIGATCTSSASKGTLIDIGGGSTELTALTNDGDKFDLSLGMGSVSSYAKHVQLVLPTSDEIESIRRDFKEKLYEVKSLDQFDSDIIYGIGGSIRAVAKLAMVVFKMDSKPKEVSLAQIDEMFMLLESDPGKFAHSAVKAVPDRLHSLVPGAVILHTCMNAFGATVVSVRKYGVREGFLLEKMLRI